MSVVAPKHLEAMIRLVGEVRFAQAAEAAESVHWMPPKAAIGGKGSDSAKSRHTENLSAGVGSQRRSLGALGIEVVMFLLFRSGLAAVVVVGTGPACTQRLPCWRVGSGVGAEYAPTPSTEPSQLGLAQMLQGRTVAWFGKVLQQHATSPAKATVRAARPNTSLKRSANGRPPAPGRWYAVHFHRPGAGVLPLSPA